MLPNRLGAESVIHCSSLPMLSNAGPLHFEPLLTALEAAPLLNHHPVTLLRWAREGRVPHHRLGRKVMFRASELNLFVTTGYTGSAVRAA